MTDTGPVLVGRSSSHFTRTARIFALELGVPHAFRAVLDMTTADPDAYAENPALKVPIWLDEKGPLFGTENICHELARRSGKRDRVVLRGEGADRLLANAEELVLHAMGAQVILVTTAVAGEAHAPPPKVRQSLENALAFLDTNLERALAALPADRALSFFEVALFCAVTHFPFRQTLDVSGYRNLQAFSRAFGERAAAQATQYRFDAASP